MSKKRIIFFIIGALFVIGLVFSFIIFSPKELSINVSFPSDYDFNVSGYENYVVADSDSISLP